MPVQRGKSGIAGKLGNRLVQAHEKHKADETVLQGGGDLPPGIENGIAQLVYCRFGQYKSGDNQGEYFFMAQGVVKSPEVAVIPNGDGTHQRVPVQGLRTKIGPEALCDTPNASGKRKTLDDHLGWVYNELRKLGVDTKELDPTNLEDTAAALEEAKPHFRFRTWQGQATDQYPNPRVNEDWRGIVDYEGEANGQLVDGTSAEEEAMAQEESAEEEAAEEEVESEETTEEETSGETELPDDVDELVALANGDDGDETTDAARIKLGEMCEAAGTDPNPLPSWEAVAEAIKSASKKKAPAAKASTAAKSDGPKLKEVYYYSPLDPKTKKPAKKALECEVVAVSAKDKTVNLKSLDDGKTFKTVKWSDLKDQA